jgi:hypothetical protein
MARRAALLAAALLAGCATGGAPPGGSAAPSTAPVAEGTALANCKREIWRRSGEQVRITSVNIFEEQRGIISGTGSFGTRYDCFTNPAGKAVNVTVDRRRRF